MAKNVALSNTAYNTLEKMKRPGESFSDVVNRIAESKNKPNWRDSVGVFENDEEANKIFDKILKERHIVKKRRVLKW